MTPKPSPSPSDPLFEGLTYSRAKNAFWLGFFSLFCFGFLTGIPAIFVGAQALSDIDASGGASSAGAPPGSGSSSAAWGRWGARA